MYKGESMQRFQTALVVDDDHLEREYLSELLLRKGFVVKDAASVPNAAAVVRGMRFDCIFIDDRMTRHFGREVLAELRKSIPPGGNPDPLYFLLGDIRDPGAKTYREDGFVCFLEKPVDAAGLYETLDTLADPEKAEKFVEVAALTRNTEETEDRTLSGIGRIPGLNPETGIANCGSEENYLSALKIFYESIRTKADEIEHYFEEEDWKNYTIKVHALKSSARIIGALLLSGQAADLEEAGNRGNFVSIRENTGSLLQVYRGFEDALAPIFAAPADGAADERPEADAATIADAYHSIGEFADQMDYDLVEMVLKSMDEYRLGEEDRERFKRIRSALSAIDWDTIRNEVKNV